MRKSIKLFFILFLIHTFAQAQISEGGFPMQVISLKSLKKNMVEMPELLQSVIDAAIEKNNDKQLKSLTFAHAFEVNINPSNSGQWYTTNSGYNVWKLSIASKNAYSINLIFNDFELPEGSRLFIYNEENNHYLGAFTSGNNKKSRKFAVAPVAGDELTVQYEIPEELGTPSDFEIVRVNHDFMGILKTYRRPLGISGDCNVDVNCEIGYKWEELKNSVCRLFVNGEEACTGTLVNNTAEDQKPYVLSAWHCYDEWDYAETTVFTFNYESPYCAPLDGDPVNSLSGAVMKAHFDSLDFALVEMSVMPPPDFRPYYAGWDRSAGLPDSSISIHHPLGDIKKITFDNDEAAYATYTSASINNPTNGSFKIYEWDDGVTEAGSSGGPLFNTSDNVIGTLTGGRASCGYPYDDYYSRFAMQWDYSDDTTKQLKHWLDPTNSGVSSLSGNQFNEGEDLCKAFTNLSDVDEHGNIVITVSGESKGYWGGSNSVGIDEVVEKFSIPGNEVLDGVSFGVGKLETSTNHTKITVNVYNGSSEPEDLIYSKVVDVRNWADDAMNYVSFDELVEPADTFFVGFGLDGSQVADSFVVYQSLRQSEGLSNYFYFKRDGSWYNFAESNTENYTMVNVMELVACNCDIITDTPNIAEPAETVWIYPNPTRQTLIVESDESIYPESVKVFNLIGQEVDVRLEEVDEYRIKVNLQGQTTGVYFVRFKYEDSFVSRKFSYLSE